MIRIRKASGEVETVPDACFVEVTDEEGRVAEVTFQQGNSEIRRIQHGDSRYRDYARLYSVAFISRFIRLGENED